MEPLEFVTASANPDKVAEIASVLALALPRLRLLPRPAYVAEVIEDADSLLGNARLKAQALTRATGLPAIADDTGLFVDALDGAPGIWAARFAGEKATYTDNCRKLLAELEAHGAMQPERRHARFVTVALIAWPDGQELWCEASVDGVIADAERGEGGFGYDPIFVPIEAEGRTFAELGAKRKNELSHRARAFRMLATSLEGRSPNDR